VQIGFAVVVNAGCGRGGGGGDSKCWNQFKQILANIANSSLIRALRQHVKHMHYLMNVLYMIRRWQHLKQRLQNTLQRVVSIVSILSMVSAEMKKSVQNSANQIAVSGSREAKRQTAYDGHDHMRS
jgi:transposase